MFPVIDENLIATTAETQEAPQKMGTSFLFDFKKGDFPLVDGRLIKIKDLPALKVWIEKILKTERFKFKVYDPSDYGISLSDFVSSDYPLDFLQNEIEREVRECLERNLEILSVHSFEFEREKRGLRCTFTADTTFGEVESEVIV